jgi:tRNA G10  N-methylase Trm11
MTTAKRYTIVECHNDDEVWFKMKEVTHGEYVLYSDYKELEQDLKDSELRRKDLLTSLQRANAQKAELEHEKTELMECLSLTKDLIEDFEYGVNQRSFIPEQITKLLNKHAEAHNG